MKNYKTPAPTWLRVLRDSWSIIGAAAISWVSTFDLLPKTNNIVAGTITFIGAMVTIACMFFIQNKTSDKDIEDNNKEKSD